MLGLACAKIAPPPPAPPQRAAAVRTDASRYAFRSGPYGPEVTIVTTFAAPPDRPVRLLHCNGALSLGLQRREGHVWVNAWTVETNGCASAPIVVAPGATYRATLTVVSRVEWPVAPGTYRAVWHNVLLPDDRELPLAQRVSAPIVLE